MLPNAPVISKNTEMGTVVISDIKTDPVVIHKGNDVKINAAVINNSPHTISFVGPGCGNSPLLVTFDKNVNTHPSDQFFCQMYEVITLKPGENAMVTGPSLYTVSTAIGAGNTTANVTFEYTDEQGNNENTVSKPFVFEISN